MKKSTNIFRFVIPSGYKLQKKKNKYLESNNTKQLNEQKTYIVQVILNNKNKSIKFKFQAYKPLRQVKEIIYNKVNKYSQNIGKVIGFFTNNSNLAYDYKFQAGYGFLDRNITLNCLLYQNMQGLQKYKICCCLAIGGFSKVFLVRSKINSQFFAAKFIDKSKKKLISIGLIQNQKQISSKLDCPFLVKTYQFFENSQFYVFIMEYCPGGQLFYLLKQIKCMREDQARIYFIQILLGIQYIHKAGYMYRDLKPENILLDSQGFLKIADFGLSKQYHRKSYSFCGSIQYMAPQIIEGCGHKQFVDFYCLGALLFEMLVGHPPFYDSRCNNQQTKAKILTEAIYFPKDLMSQSAKDFIKKLTKKNEKQRLGYFGGCKQIMSHPWVGKINRKVYQQKQFIPPFPVNLNQLNFDPEQIGQSQRIFQQRVNLTIGMAYKSNNKIQCKQTFSLQKKPKSVSQKKITKNQSFSVQKNKSLIIKNIKYTKNPYETILKLSKNFEKTKQQRLKTQNGQNIIKKKLLSNVRWTESQDGEKFKTILNNSNLQKKSKFIPFLTTIEANYSPQKKFEFQQKLKQ